MKIYKGILTVVFALLIVTYGLVFQWTDLQAAPRKSCGSLLVQKQPASNDGGTYLTPPSDGMEDSSSAGNNLDDEKKGNGTESDGKSGDGKKERTYTSKEIKKVLKSLESETSIPTVCIYTEEGKEVVSREDYVNCEVYTINCDKAYKLVAEPAGIRVRGNSTAYGGNVAMIRANQVPYKIKFETKTSMFGLNDDAECKKWVLVKAESSLLKTDIAFTLGRAILHEGNYCSDGILVHVYLNGKFKGIYELCEQNQVNKNRVNITKTRENYKGTDVGYLLEIDNYGESPCFRVNYENATVTDLEGKTKKFKGVYYSIKSDVYSDEQKAFIKKYLTNVFKIVYEACEHEKYYVFDEDYNLVKAKKKFLKQTDENGEPLDPAYITINNVMNLESVADLYLVYEIVKDRDVGEGSFYMYADFGKESLDSRLTFTCPWDFEWAYDGSTSELYASVFNTDAFASVYEERSNPWFILLMKQDWFKSIVGDRWQELRTPQKGKKTDVITDCLNYEKEILEKYPEDLVKSSRNSIKYANNLLEWVKKRIQFLDGWLLDD